MRRPLLLLPLLLALTCARPTAAGEDGTFALLEQESEPAGVVLGPSGGECYDGPRGGGWPWEVSREDEERPGALGAWLAARLPEAPSARRASLARLAADALRRVVVDIEIEGERRLVGRIVVRPGHRGVLADVSTARVVCTYTAELACDNTGGEKPSAVGDPIVATLLEGVAVDLRPFVLDGGTTIALDAVVQAGRFDRPVGARSTGARFLGRVDLPVWRGTFARFSGACPAGGVLEAALRVGGRDLRVRLRPRLEPGARPDRGGVIRDHDLDLLLYRFPGMGVETWRRAGLLAVGWLLPPDRPALAPLELETLVTDLGADALMLRRDGVGGWIAADDAVHGTIGRRLDVHRRAAARTATVEVTARAGGAIVGHVRLPALPGRTSYGRLGVDRAVFPDPDVEVG